MRSSAVGAGLGTPRAWPRCSTRPCCGPARPTPARPRRPVDRRGPPAPLRPQGQADHLPVHGRRAVAPGDARLQARRWPRCTASRCPSRSPRACRSPSSRGRSSSASRPSTRSAAAGPAGRRSARSSRTSATIADEICIIRSMVTEAINHDPAHTFMNTGTTISGRPAMGSWLTYGLGSESDDLPGLRRPDLDRPVRPGPADRRAAVAQRLPAQPVPGRAVLLQGRPGALPGQPHGHRPPTASATWSTPSSSSNQIEDEQSDDPEIATRIAAYETAFRMQTSVPELIDLSSEPKHVLDLYGTEGGDGSFAANCLLARRLAERGVRFIQLYHRDWDHHGGIKEHVPGTAARGRPGRGGADQGPEAARDARRHAGHLGRRVRPHADGPGQRPRPPHQGLLDLDGRRRHQGRA